MRPSVPGKHAALCLESFKQYFAVHHCNKQTFLRDFSLKVNLQMELSMRLQIHPNVVEARQLEVVKGDAAI